MKNTVKIENLGPFLSRSPFPRNFGVFWNSGKLGILEFRKNFPGKFWIGGSWISGNTYILEFLVILSTKIPGNSRKCRPQIFVKTKNFGENFPGKSEFRLEYFGKHVYSCIFTHWGDLNSREFQKRWGPDFDENQKLGSTRFGEKSDFSPREFRETRIFLHFYKLCWPQFPGISEKGGPRFSWKLEILEDPGKLWDFCNFGHPVSFLCFVKFQKSHLFC